VAAMNCDMTKTPGNQLLNERGRCTRR